MAVKDKNELFVTVPSLFRCPISMDVMKSPVSLCTGVTYDRSSIQTWIETGHNTCPATMQVLPSTDFIPNLTLRRLIHLWSQSNSPSHLSPKSSSAAAASTPSLSAVSKQQVLRSIRSLEKSTGTRSISLARIADFADFSEENREFLASVDGFVETIVEVLRTVDEIEILESIVRVLDLIVSERRIREQLHRLIFRSERVYLSPFVDVLQRGDSNSRSQSARVLESISFNPESQRAVAEKKGLLHELYRLTAAVDGPEIADAGLSCLIALSAARPVKKELVRFGIVKAAANIISRPDAASPVIEKALKLLEMVSTCSEGRTAIGEDENCVAEVVKRLMKVSRAATEHAVAVLWSVCYLSRDRTAQEAAVRNNGLTKLLLVMQSDCAASARQMCGDLVKVLRVNSKSCLASYETRTTHITPY